MNARINGRTDAAAAAAAAAKPSDVRPPVNTMRGNSEPGSTDRR